ncbi:NADPH-dependent F420 reductase [Pengzhenrongella sp.]|jgi:predicted dinucleotide-binding enzyme|uniref:NADPH-dependent F420 reductase n=1 Tax=Pengzhenrongella sp. TaxID=2888820 RepID=UPI002F95D60B
MATIGFIGAGRIGGTIAQLAIRAGYDVVMSNSRGPETLVDLVAELGDSARAATAYEAGEAGDFVVVTIPLKHYRAVPVEPLAGKVVVDTNNYYAERDGHIAELDAETTTSSELLQAHLPTSRVVKAFNHIRASELRSDGTPPGTPDRRALAISGNDHQAMGMVAHLIEKIGFDVVDNGPLAESWRMQPGSPAYLGRFDVVALEQALAEARRSVSVD